MPAAGSISDPHDGTLTTTILSGTSLSPAVDLGGMTLGVIEVPASFEGASLTFQVSADGTTFFNLFKSDGTEYSVTVAASRAYELPIADFADIRYIKIRSGTSGAPTNTGADRVLGLIARAV